MRAQRNCERRLGLFGSATAWIVAATVVRLTTSIARSEEDVVPTVVDTVVPDSTWQAMPD